MSSQPTDPADLELRFREVNRARLDRLQELVSARQWDLLSCIPALLYLNHADLPGYVDDNTPCGIRNHQLETATVNVLTKLVQGYRYQPTAARKLDIVSLFMMGSSGSIAFSATSDFDIWVCIDPTMAGPEREKLQQKCSRIETWADQFGLEVHFFLVDQQQFRAKGELTLSSESSGSAQRYLLLEEFYRTAIFMAGLPPLWWIVPAEQESSYDGFTRSLDRWPNIKAENYIDFGPLEDIPVEEFTGAGLWQVFKGIDSPYKSVMKMILMEAYIDEHPHTQLVSLSYKQRVQQGITELERLDPYLLMFEKAEAYLLGSDQEVRAELLRHCFYLKIGDRLSERPSLRSPRSDLRRGLMQQYVQSWGWSPAKLALLDHRSRWPISEIMGETRNIHRELSNSYAQLSRLASQRSSSTAISQSDLHVLGRRIYAALERKPGKIEIINRNQSLIAPETALTIRKALNQSGQAVWLLYDHANPDGQSRPLKRFFTLIELILWCWLNGITERNTRWLMDSEKTHTSEREIIALLRFFRQQLPLPDVLTTNTDDLAKPLRYTQLLVLVNFGYQPFADYSRKGLRLASSRSDPLSHGDSRLNTVRKLDLIYRSAWGEITTRSMVGEDALANAMHHYLTELCVHEQHYPLPQFFGFCEQFGEEAAERVEALFSTALDLSEPMQDEHWRLIYSVGRGYDMIEQTEAGFQRRSAEDKGSLIELLSQPAAGGVTNYFEAQAADCEAIAVVSRLNNPGTIQLFVQVVGEKTHFHIIDEGGAYFMQSTETYELKGQLCHLKVFVDNVIARLALTRQSHEQISTGYYQLVKNKQGRWQAREVELNLDPGHKIIDIHALATPSNTGSPALSIIFRGDEFSSLEWGAELYQRVAWEMLTHRQSGQNYPIYITDVELALPASGEAPLQSIHYFKYKRSIEERLTDALQRVVEDSQGTELVAEHSSGI